jgi:outer membrane receptor protein involved in Fe transport
VAPAEETTTGQTLEEIVVTGSREAELQKEKPATVGVIDDQKIKNTKPAHPAEIMNQIPGVWVGVTAGEGHQTAIRQPLTTSAVYLFLEDGIPIRSTGFFNHNALYETDILGAERIEVYKGPSSALYGSDAIGGTINVITRPAPPTPEVELNPEIGEYGWYRLLATAGNTWGDDGLRFDLNATHADGWRERTGYERQSGTLRWDRAMGETATAKTLLSYSDIDQETGGSSTLTKADFDSRPWYNYQTFDFRKVKAFRLSTELTKEPQPETLLSAIPYLRINEMDLLPGWGIFKSGPGYAGYDSTTEFYSLGLLLKYRYDFAPWRTRLITGVDIDYSPGSYFERRILVERNAADNKFVSYTYDTDTANNYDYDATFAGGSPYLQVESSPIDPLRLTLGARYDYLTYDYTTNLEANKNRPADADPNFSHLSPKAGLTYAFTEKLSGFLSYANAFRVPSAGDLFKGNSGTAASSINLKPIKANNYEAGLNGAFNDLLSYSLSYYHMIKKDDIVTYSPATNVRERLNAGETKHRGVEIGVGLKPIPEIELSCSYANSLHTFEEFSVSATKNFNDKDIPLAPREIVDTRLTFKPAWLQGGQVELEWVRLGSYWLDNANTEKYDGHDLYNLRASYHLTSAWELYARLINIADEAYAETSSKSETGEAMFAPGQPRTLFGGVTWRWGGSKS